MTPLPYEIWPGSPGPAGARANGEGTNFSLWSRVAERVELCLFPDGGDEVRLDLPSNTDHRWYGFVPGVGPGMRYGFRVHGPYAPGNGHRCNPNKLLLDPYARAIDGEFMFDPAVLDFAESYGSDVRSTTDSAPFVPRGVVIDPSFDWGDDAPPRTARDDTVIYEVHVKGFTKQHPGVPEELRGTYAGLAHDAAIDHLRALGITAVELMPVQAFLTEPDVAERGQVNYWGYNPIAWFAPHPAYAHATDPQAVVDEFKGMVKHLHAAGIEVILDVVYNHTAELSAIGPTLSLRGIDNEAYYRLGRDDRHHNVNYTGCGNTVDLRVPGTLALVMDSLRYLVTECHVDGFRFDLATSLGRTDHGFHLEAPFIAAVHQDPILSAVKLIAEPWDLGLDGYQLGQFPPPWAEWNDRFRDTVRDYWRGVDETLPEIAARLSGSEDVFAASGRGPLASINFVTAHDGFTLRDLVSYDEKHNELNGERNHDGHDDNRSWNCGVEGPTDDPDVLALRARQQRNLLATVLLSQGVPMLLSGDELGRTQLGNNNAYCIDSELTWLDWDGKDDGLLTYVQGLVAYRRAHPVFRRRHWLVGRLGHDERAYDTAWLTWEGEEMSERHWQVATSRSMQVFLNGEAIKRRGDRGEPVADDSFLLLLNADAADHDFELAGGVFGGAWQLVLDTADGQPPSDRDVSPAGHGVTLSSHHLVLFRRVAVG
jgi:glycogen operon protein